MTTTLFSKEPPQVELHPVTIRMLKQGHPWVTLDQFSKRFPKDALFLKGARTEDALLLHDPEHKSVVARLWGMKKSPKMFEAELKERMETAIRKRENVLKERDNAYLIFGEADFLPGLFVQKLGKNLLIHYYAAYWKKLEDLVMANLPKDMPIWIQERNHLQKNTIRRWKNHQSTGEFVIQEFGVKYKIRLDENYDNGIYTDMSSIRKKLLPYLKKSEAVLNLYSYTGAFSLFALAQGAEVVISVDLSRKYLDWLEENLHLNPELPRLKHHSLCMSVDKGLGEIDRKFDLVICDPPSVSSDGKKMANVLTTYENIFDKLVKITKPGGHLLVFINNHQITWKKWEEKIAELTKLKIVERFRLGEDCPVLKSFHEGDYLKGILLKVE